MELFKVTKLQRLFFLLIVVVCLSGASDVKKASALEYASSTGQYDYVGIFSSNWQSFLTIEAWQVSEFPFNNAGISTLLKNPKTGCNSFTDESQKESCLNLQENNPTSVIRTGEEVSYLINGSELTLSQIFHAYGLGEYIYISNNCGFNQGCGFNFIVTSSTTINIKTPPPSTQYIDFGTTTAYNTRILESTVESGASLSSVFFEDQGTRTYQRISGGYKVTSTLEIAVEFDSSLDIGATLDTFWCVELYNSENDIDVHNDPVPISETQHVFTFEDLPLGGYSGVFYFTSATEECSNASANEVFANLEYDDENLVFEVVDFEGVRFIADYFLDTAEIVSTISVKNPTSIKFELAKRPETEITGQGENIDNTQNGTGTVSTTFVSLTDGTYDVLVKFSNIGCSTGLSSCPFPLTYIYSTFTLESGIITDVGENEVYSNIVTAPSISQYEDCGLINIGGCINNSFRFLFMPSQDSINSLIATKDQLDDRIPFVYVADIRIVADEIFNTAQAETLDVELNLGFGTIEFINEEMIANAPQASLIRQLLSYMLWITFALGAYRMALGIHNKETV